MASNWENRHRPSSEVYRQAVLGMLEAMEEFRRHVESLGAVTGPLATPGEIHQATVQELQQHVRLWAAYECGWRDHARADPDTPPIPDPEPRRPSPGPERRQRQAEQRQTTQRPTTLSVSTLVMDPQRIQRRTDTSNIQTSFPPLTALVPAPPSASQGRSLKMPPPAPNLRVMSCENNTIVLTWFMNRLTRDHAEIKQYQLFINRNGANWPNIEWTKIADIDACPLAPMTCTITGIEPSGDYSFIIRAIDEHNRPGTFSRPKRRYIY